MALQAIGNVNLEFANTGRTSTVDLYYTQPRPDTWARAEGINLADYPTYLQYIPWATTSVIDSGGSVITTYNQHNNLPTPSVPSNSYMMIVKFNSTSNVMWRRQIPHTGETSAVLKSMCLDTDDNAYLLFDIIGTKDIRVIKVNNKTVPQSNLVLHLDANTPISYPGTGTLWYNLANNIPSAAANLTNDNYSPYYGQLPPTYSNAGGGQIVFTGNYGYVNIASEIVLGNTYTISAWIKTNYFYWNTLFSRSSIPISYGDPIKSIGVIISEYNQDGKLYAGGGTSNSSESFYKIHDTFIRDDQWHHIAAVFDQTANTITGYVDGVQGLTVSASFDGSSYSPSRNQIGKISYYNSQTFSGNIHQFLVHNRALSSEEISRLSRSFGSATPTVAWAKNYYVPGAFANADSANGVNRIVEKNGKLYISTSYSGLLSVETSNGNIAWTRYVDGSKGNTQLVYSSVLNGNVYSISAGGFYHVHNFNANTGNWNDTKTYFNYPGIYNIFNYGLNDGLGVVATDGYDLYIRQWTTVTKVEGANTNNVIWYNYISNGYPGGYYYQPYTEVGWTDLTFDIEPTSNSANQFYTFGRFYRGDFYTYAPVVQRINKDNGAVNRAIFIPFAPLTNLNGYESKKYVLSVRNANLVFSGFDFTNDNKGNMGWKSITYKMKENFDVLDYFYGANSVYIEVYYDSYYFFSNSKPNIASYVYTWNPISVTTNNITITLNTPSPPAGRQFNEDRAWGFPNVENYIDGWIPDTRQAIGMEANSVINQPNSKSFFSVFGANSGLNDRNYTYTSTIFNNMDLDREGNIITIGNTDMGENTQYKEAVYTEKAQLTKWSKEGDVIWSKTIRGTANIADVYIYDDSYGILTKVDKRNDDIYALTEQDHLYSYYLTKFDKNGNYLWNRVLYDQWDIWDINIDTNGDVYVIGGQPWITVFTESGQYKWGVAYDDWSTNIYPLCSAFDSNAKILLIGDENYSNVYAFDKLGNYKWTYNFNNINESGDAVLDIAIDDTQANTWYVSNYDNYGIDGNYAYYDGTAITKMQGYEDPQRIVRKFLYSYSGWDWNYTPRMYATKFSKLISKGNKIYANGGTESNEDGGFQFFRFDKDLTTVDVNTFFVDQQWYRLYQNYWWGSNFKIDSFVVDNEGYMIHCGWWEPWTIAEEPFDAGHYYSYDDRAVILRVPADGTLAHRWDDRYQNDPFGNIVRPEWRQFSYNRADQVIDLDTNDYFPEANLGWFETDTEPSYGKTTDHADFFRKNQFFSDVNIIDYIWSNVTPLIYNTFDGGFINAAPYNTQVGNFIVLQTANGKSYVNSSSKLLDVSTNLIIGNTLTPVFNVNNKSWAFQSWRDNYPNVAYTAYEFSVDTKIDSKNNVILIDQTQLFTNGNGVAVGVTKFNEYGDQLWSYYTPPSWEGIDTYGSNDTIYAIGSTIDSNDNIYIFANRVGNTAQSNTVNAVIAKIDSNGSLLWAKRYYDGQSDRYTYLHAQDGMLFMCRSDDYGFPGYYYGYYAYRREAALFRINPDNGDIIWAVDRPNRPYPNQFYCIKKHNNMVLMGCEDYTYFAFDLDGNFLFAREWDAPFYGSSDITGIESDGTNYYLMNVFGVVSKVDGNTHNVIWTNYYYSYPGNQYGNIRYENGTLYLFCPPYSDGAGARVLKIDPTSGNVLYDKYVALDTVPSGRIDYFKVWNSTWSFGFDARYDKASFVGYVEDGSLRDAPSYGERRFLAKLDTSDNLIESDMYSLKPYYANNVTVLSRKANWTYTAGEFGELQLEIGRYEPPEYNVFANVITNPTYTNWIKMNVANIGVVSLTGNLLPTPNTTNGANLYNYTSKRDILSSPYFITTSNNAPVNTNVSINFYGGLTINSHVQAARTYKDSCWVARWGTYNEVNSGYYYNTYYDQIRWDAYSYDGESQLNSVCVDSTGNTWSTGWWQNYMLGNGLRPMVLKHDKDGKLLKYYAADGPRIFNGVYSGQLYQAGETITCDANNNVYIQILDWSYATRPTSMIAFIKLDSEGNLLWKNAIEFAETDLYDGVRMVVNSSANKLFFIMTDYYSDGYPTIMCLNSLTGEYLWSKNFKDIYDDGYDAYEYTIEPLDIVTFGNRLYVMTYDVLITMDLDGNIITSKTLEYGFFDSEGLSITTDNTNLYILIGSSYYSSNSRIVKIDLNNLENPGLFNATWISELNSYSQPKIRSISYSNNKIIAIGSRSNIYNDNDPIVWTIDSATGETLFAGEITVIGTRWFEYNDEALNYYNNDLIGVGGHKSVAVKDKNVYIAGQATYVAMPPYPYYVSDNYPDTALIKLENDSRNFTSQSEHGADPDPSGDYPIIIFNSKNVYSNVISVGYDLSFADYYYASGNYDTITANSVTYTPISNSANILFGDGIFSDNSIYYYANSTFFKELTPIIKFGEGKNSDVLNVDSILKIGRGSNPYSPSSNIQEPLYIWARSNKTNAVNSIVFAQSFREKAISLMGGANATIDLNLGGVFTYYLTSGFSLNNIIIIENSVAKTANAVQSFTLFTYGVDTVSNSVWANANIAWPRNAVPNKLNGSGFAKVSFMKLPSSNLWYGFYQANTVNVSFAKTKVLNSLTFTKELVSGMPIWGYDTARGNNALIVKFNDATICGGSNTYSGVKQESTYTFIFENEEDIYLTSMNVTSNVESGRNGYDRLKIIYSKTDFNGTAQTVIYEAFSQDTAGQLTCVGRPAYVNIAPPNNMMLTANTYHRFDLIANTVDNLYHSGSYYSVLFDFRKKT